MKKTYFMNRNILLWIVGSTLSTFGDVFTSTAIPLVTFNLTKSAKFSAFVLFVDILSTIVLAPMIGMIVDKYSKKKIIFFSNIVSIFVLLSFLIIDGNEWYYLVGNSMISISAKFYAMSAKTMLPDIVYDKNIMNRVNNLISLSLKCGRILGATLATIILSFFGTNILFLFDASSFFINIVCLSMIQIDDIKNRKTNKMEEKNYVFMDAIRYFAKNKLFLMLCVIYGSLFFVEGFMQSQMVVFIKKYLMLEDTYYAFYQNSLLAGVVFGQIILSRYEMDKKEFFLAKIGMVLVIGSLIGIFALKHLIFSVFYGFGQPFIVTSWYGYFYKYTPEPLRGRILSVSSMCFDGIHLLSVAFVYILCDYFIPQQNFIFVVIILISLFLTIFMIERRRKYEVNRTEHGI